MFPGLNTMDKTPSENNYYSESDFKKLLQNFFKVLNLFNFSKYIKNGIFSKIFTQ